jgi:hypothetical protein
VAGFQACDACAERGIEHYACQSDDGKQRHHRYIHKGEWCAGNPHDVFPGQGMVGPPIDKEEVRGPCGWCKKPVMSLGRSRMFDLKYFHDDDPCALLYKMYCTTCEDKHTSLTCDECEARGICHIYCEITKAGREAVETHHRYVCQEHKCLLPGNPHEIADLKACTCVKERGAKPTEAEVQRFVLQKLGWDVDDRRVTDLLINELGTTRMAVVAKIQGPRGKVRQVATKTKAAPKSGLPPKSQPIQDPGVKMDETVD